MAQLGSAEFGSARKLNLRYPGRVFSILKRKKKQLSICWTPTFTTSFGSPSGFYRHSTGFTPCKDVPPSTHSNFILAFPGSPCRALVVGPDVIVSPPECTSQPSPTATQCSFSCVKGHRIRGPPVKECLDDGTWSHMHIDVTCHGNQ